MTEIHSPKQTEATAYFCPKCHSPNVERSGLLVEGYDGDAECNSCKWSGRTSQLAQSTFKHGFQSDEEIASSMMRDLRNLLAKTVAHSYGKFLLKWGFLDQPISSLQLATYLEAIANAVVKTIVETRKKLVEEKTRDRSGLPRPAGDERG